MTEPNRWRGVIALFVNEHTRKVAGRLLAGEVVHPDSLEFSPSRRKHIVNAVLGSGIAEVRADGSLSLVPAVFTELLAQGAAEARTGVDRFLEDGRIATYPASLREREVLLRWVRDQVVDSAETLQERELNERLERFHEDVAVLRRYLVDFSLLERRADGTEYRRTDT
ncbi:MAG: DUF2087 domain-containing protein [Microbacterium sp.]